MTKRALLKRLRNKCRKLWRLAVLKRWGSKCVICGQVELPNCHHIVARDAFATLRYDSINGVPLCPSHHKYGKFSAHRNALWFIDMIHKLLKFEEIEYLMLKMNQEREMPKVITDVAYYENAIKKLETEVNNEVKS
jgi:hypothetical protein